MRIKFLQHKNRIARKIPAVLAGLFTIAVGFTGQEVAAQPTYSFTPAGATGSLGPTQSDVNTAYASTNLNGLVTSNNGIQEWVVPLSGSYEVIAIGAAGGSSTTSPLFNPGGQGSSIRGVFNFTAGDVIRILVGQKGDTKGTASGGGGSFVTRNNTLLIVGGGGGGATPDQVGAHSTTVMVGTNDNPGGPSQGGFGGHGGLACNSGVNNGGGGGGYLSDGATGTGGSNGGGGLAFMNGGTGGSGVAPGGFGGGGGALSITVGGGGGGGYSGGGGGQQTGNCAPVIMRSGGGGGASYNSGSDQVNTGGANSGDGEVNITFLCDIEISASSNPVCEGAVLTLTTNAITTLSWSTGSSTGSSIVLNPTVGSSYHVTGIGVNNCTATAVIDISVTPLPAVQAVANPVVLCAGRTATLSGSGAVSYTWSAGTPGASSIQVSPSVSTTYTLEGENTFGCVNTKTVTVVVNSNSLLVSPDVTICEGDMTVLSASSAQSYTWSTGNSLPAIQVSPLVTTSYSVVAVDANYCEFSHTVQVTVRPGPPVVATADKTEICKGETVELTASGADTYAWYNPVNGTASGASLSLVLLFDLPYQYTVTGTDSHGCSSTATLEVIAGKCTGIAELNGEEKSFVIYPNPGNGVFFLETSGSGGSLEIQDVAGRKIAVYTITPGKNQIDLSAFDKGVYYARMSGTSGPAPEVFKLVKQ
jgi:hypothetical protein